MGVGRAAVWHGVCVVSRLLVFAGLGVSDHEKDGVRDVSANP